MIDITVGQAQRLTSPNPFGLLTTVKQDGTDNVMAVSWWTYLSNRPPMLGVCLSKKKLSGSLIEKNGEFVLNIVGESLKDAAKSCGSCSGKDVDKVKEFGIPLEPASAVGAKLVSGSRVAFECKLISQADASDHMFYIAEIVAVHGDSEVPQVFAWDGFSRVDTI